MAEPDEFEEDESDPLSEDVDPLDEDEDDEDLDEDEENWADIDHDNEEEI